MARAAHRERSKQLRTLVLNADARPLTVWPISLMSANDSVKAAWLEKVNVVETWEDAFYRSPSIEIAVPKVVMLRHYAPIAATPKFCRVSIFLRDRFRCQYCGEQFEHGDLTFDHVIPKSIGGKTVWDNVITSCIPCNSLKKNKLPNYSGRKGISGSLRPLKKPRQPTTAELLRAGLEFLPADVKQDFGSWLYWDTELQA